MSNSHSDETSTLLTEIETLEQRLRDAKSRLQSLALKTTQPTSSSLTPSSDIDSRKQSHSLAPHLHILLLLSDSALPLGSFAFSSGLESFLAHHPRSQSPLAQLTKFLRLSLDSITSTTLPYVIAGYLHPEELEELDNDLDASTPCTVARRASTKQGLALMGVWEKSFRAHFGVSGGVDAHAVRALEALREFSVLLKGTRQESVFSPNGHLPPLLGTLCAALSVPLDQTLYLYLFNHAKTIVSAAIRAGVLGPYQAQGVLAGRVLRDKIQGIVEHEAGTGTKNGSDDDKPVNGEHIAAVAQTRRHGGTRSTQEAGQSVPMLDLWGGRHEIIYSRIFNS